MTPDEALGILDDELERGLGAFRKAGTKDELERARTDVLGRRSRYSEVQRALGALTEDQRRSVGRRANEVRSALERALRARREALEEGQERARLESDRVDVTLPGRRPRLG